MGRKYWLLHMQLLKSSLELFVMIYRHYIEMNLISHYLNYHMICGLKKGTKSFYIINVKIKQRFMKLPNGTLKSEVFLQPIVLVI